MAPKKATVWVFIKHRTTETFIWRFGSKENQYYFWNPDSGKQTLIPTFFAVEMRLERQCGLHTTLIMNGLLANLYIWVSGLLLLQKRSSNPGRHKSIQNLLISIALILHTYNMMFAWGYTTENNMEKKKHFFCLKCNKPTHTYTQSSTCTPLFLGLPLNSCAQECSDAFSLPCQPSLTCSNTSSAAAR